MRRPLWWEALAALAALVTVLVFVTGESKMSGLVNRLTGPSPPEIMTSSQLVEAERQASEERAKRELVEREADLERARREQLEKEIAASRAAEAERARLAGQGEQQEKEMAAKRTHKAEVTIIQEPMRESKPLILQPEHGKPRLTATHIAVQHNVNVSGQQGMAVNVRFNANSLQGRHLYVAVYFFFSSGSPLRDVDGSYKSQNGQVSTGAFFIPQDQQAIGAVTLEIPYAELHVVPNVHSNLGYKVLVYDRDATEGPSVLYASAMKHFYLD